MLIVQFDTETRENYGELREVKRYSATTIKEVADAMFHADYGTWIEGIGQPTCHHDLATWKMLGTFLANIAKESTA